MVLKYSNITISNTSRAEQKRITLGLQKQRSIVIPNGVYLTNTNFPIKKIDKRRFVYVGNITHEHGLLNAIESMVGHIDELIIIGIGRDLENLKSICRKNNINYRYLGKMTHFDTIKYLQSFEGFGLAPYNSTSEWTYYCSPLKVNEYIANGIPVIISDIPEIATEIKTKGLGIVYHSIKDIIPALNEYNTKSFNEKAKMFYENYNYEKLFSLLYKLI